MNDSQQRQKALDITKSFIVQAPAGSGKTELLTQRYLKLLSLSKNPESVVALTFTNKAVAELKERVIASLQMPKPKQKHKLETFKLAQKVLELDKKYNWCLLKNQHRLSILTLDSLAAKIDNNYPQTNDFATKNVLDEFASKELYIDAATQTLLSIDENYYIQSLLKHLDNNCDNFIDLVAKMLKVRDKWITKIFDTKTINLHNIESCIISIGKQHLQNLKKLSATNFGVNFFSLCVFNPNLAKFTKTPSSIEEWIELKELLLTKKALPRKNIVGFNKSNIEQKTEFKQIIDNLSPDFIKAMADAELIPDLEIDTELLINISKTLKLADSILQDLFFQYNQTDFVQITLNALNALNTDDVKGVSHTITDIRLTLDYQIEHILLDEFQDTSYGQLDLITKIVDGWELESGRTLFLVGDPMQSIYLFRGAQVGVFLQVKESGIANINLENIVLTTNFRSSQEVVEVNNKVFSHIFPVENNIDNGAICYSPSVANTKQDTDEFTQDALAIYPFAYNQEAKEALQVLAIVQKCQAKNQEVAILCRSRTAIKIVIDLFKEQNIEFEGVKNYKLSDNIFALDLLNIVRVLLNKMDKLAWFGILRSPFVGLKLDDILSLSSGDDVWHNLQTINLATDAQLRVEQLIVVFNNAFANFGSFATSDILVNIAENLNFNKRLNNIEQIIFSKFNQILHNCEITNKLSVNDIYNHLQDSYAPSIKSDIKVMTIHQAKGLEFENVIIVGIGKKPKNPNKDLIMINEFKDHGVLLATQSENKDYAYLHHISKTRQDFEAGRLLYVAMTRAKNHIYLTGATDKNNKPNSKSFLELLWGLYSSRWSKVEADDSNQQIKIVEFSRYKDIAIAKKSMVLRPEKAGTITTDIFNSRAVGEIIHKILQLEKLDINNTQIKNQLLNFGIGLKDIDNLLTIIQQSLQKTKNSLDFDFVFQIRTTTKTEVEFVIDNQSIIIDRLFVDNDILYIIDFKTAIYTAEITIDAFIDMQVENHKKQLQTYKNYLTNIYPQPIKTAIFLTNVGRMVFLD